MRSTLNKNILTSLVLLSFWIHFVVPFALPFVSAMLQDFIHAGTKFSKQRVALETTRLSHPASWCSQHPANTNAIHACCQAKAVPGAAVRMAAGCTCGQTHFAGANHERLALPFPDSTQIQLFEKIEYVSAAPHFLNTDFFSSIFRPPRAQG